jgi:type II secretory pathway component GspD/PulD (secretin)
MTSPPVGRTQAGNPSVLAVDAHRRRASKDSGMAHRLRACCGWMLCAVLLSASAAHVGYAQVLPTAPPGGEGIISLELKGLDILDVLKLFSQKSDLSFIAGRNVTGRVTLFIKEVPLWDAFEVIIAANDLAYETRGSMVTVMTGRDYELIYGAKFQDPKEVKAVSLQNAQATQLATVLNQVKTNVGRVIVDESSNTVILMDLPGKVAEMERLIAQLDISTEMRTWELNYAIAEDLQDTITESLTPNIGTIQFDERTNKVIVTDIPSVIAQVDTMIQAFDARTREVLIEARIVEISLTDTHKAGIDWDYVLGALNEDDSAFAGNFDVLGDIISGAATGWAWQFTGGPIVLNFLVEMLDTIAETNTVSSPSIAVTNKGEAKFLVGTKEAFVTTTVVTPGGGSPTTTAEQVTFVDVGISLSVTPTIMSDGFVSMDIRPEVSSVSRTLLTSQGNEIPIVTTTEAETNVLLKDGATLMLGGLLQDKVSDNENKIPLLGDVPFLQHLFRNTTNTKTKTEIIVFLTPYIITGDEGLLELQEKKIQRSVDQRQLNLTLSSFEVRPINTPIVYREAVWVHLRHQLLKAYAAVVPAGNEADIQFTLRRDGVLIGDPIIHGVTDPTVETLTFRAVIAAAPFPALPAKSTVQEMQFQFGIEYGLE